MTASINNKADRRIKVSPEKRQQIIRLRHEGKTFKQISAETGMSFSSVQSYCSRLIAEGAIERKESVATAPHPEPKAERNQEIYKMYLEGARTVDIAKKFGKSPNTILVIVRRYKNAAKDAEIERLKRILDEHGIEY